MNKTITTMFLSLAVIFGLFAGANIVSAQSVGGTCTTQTLRGTVSPNGHATSAWFNWSSSQSAVTNKTGYNTTVQNFSGNTSNGTLFTQDLTNLTPNTTYYYRAMASWGTADTTNAGPVLSFTTPACSVTPTGSAPSVTTSSATSVGTNSATLNGYVNGNNASTNAWFEWGTTPSFGYSIGQNNTGTGSTNYTAYLSGLSANTVYYYRAMASNSYGAATPGQTQSFTTSSGYVPPVGSQPSVTTQNAGSVTASSANLNGFVNGNNLATSAWFEWGPTTNLGNTTSSNAYGTGSSNFSGYVSGLNANTVYYYRAVAQNSQGTVYGSTLNFTTSSNNNGGGNYGTQPTVTTTSASNVTTSSGLMNGYVNGNGSNTNAWFEWGTNTNFGNTTPSNSYGSGYVSFNAYATGLNSNTTYYYRAVAQNSYGTVYGNTLSFTTSTGYNNNNNNGAQATVTTVNATNITNSSATLNGFVNGNGIYTTAWFEWGTNSYFGNTTSSNSYGSGSASYNAYLPNLNANTTYYFRAVAQNSQGTVYGNTVSFATGTGYYGGGSTTNTSAPSVATTLATQITDTSAQLNGLVFTSNTVSSNAWFEWGTTSSLGYKTNTVSVGNLPSVRHADTITGLVPGTTYYYRVVAENSYGRANGQTMSFVAGNNAVDNNVVINRTTTSSNTTTVVTRGVGTQSLIMLTLDGGSETIVAGETRSYQVAWKNTTNQTLKKVALRITLPQSMTFVSASRGSFSSVDNTLTINVGSLGSQETGNVSFVATTSGGLKAGELVIVVANMVYTDSSNLQGDAVAYVTHTAMNSGNALGASIFGAGSFLPTGIFGWLLLIILVLLLVLTANHLYGRMSGAPKH